MSEVVQKPSAEEIAKHYSALLDSVELINGYVAGQYGQQEIVKNEENKGVVSRNVAHLELMKAKDFWTNEDFTSIDAAIAAGKAYAA